MKNNLLILCIVCLSFQLSAQDDEYPYPSLSPKGKISQVVGNTLVEIEYERPSVRNRVIFGEGELVPWNKVWRTGAGYCTKISFSKPVIVGSQPIPAGNYSLFTIPNPEEWMVILNTDTTLYGSYDYNYKNDIARFIVDVVEPSRFYETLTFDIELINNNSKMYISWANIQLYFDIETSTDEEIEKLIEEKLLTGLHQNSDIYAGAAEFLIYQSKDFVLALQLAEKAIELDKQNEWARNLKIRIYEKLKLYDNALVEINKAVTMLKKKGDRTREISQLETDFERIQSLQK